MTSIKNIKKRVAKRELSLKKLGKFKLPDGLKSFVADAIKEGDYKGFLQIYLQGMNRTTLKESGDFHFGGARSIPDMYRLVLSYFPNVTLAQLVEAMIDSRVNRWYCSTPDRVVFGGYGDAGNDTWISYMDASGLNITYKELCLAYSKRNRWIKARQEL